MIRLLKVVWLFVILAIALTLTGCPWPWEPPPPPPTDTLTIILLDRTKSFKYLEQAKNHLTPVAQDDFYSKGILGAQKNGDVFGLVGITSRAKGEDTIIPPTEIEGNPYNPNMAKAEREALAEKIRSVSYENGSGTDLIGAIFKAVLVMKDPVYSEDFEKFLVIYSDLDDNLSRLFQVDLKDINVVVLFFSPDLEPETLNASKPDPNAWETRFKNLGAKTVRIVYVDNSYNANPYE